jgi:hypothetical protein
MIREHDRVALTSGIPAARLEAGDIGTVVHVYPGEKAYELEFVLLDGNTLTVVTVEAGGVRPIGSGDLPSARPIPQD